MPSINTINGISVASIQSVDGVLSTAISNISGLLFDQAETHVFLLAGQSNMVGRASFDNGTAYPTGVSEYAKATGFSSSYSNTTTSAASSPLGHWDSNAGDMGLDLQFCIDYVAANSVNMVLIAAADGGTGFVSNEWNPGDTRYEHAVDATNAFMAANASFDFKGILWHQGEKDYTNSDFANQFYLMIQSMRNDITVASQETPFILGELLPGGSNTATLNSGVLTDTPTHNYKTALVSAASLTGVDALHFNAASLRTFGSRYHTSFAGLGNPYPTAESGAVGHWLLGNSNQLYIDLTGTPSNMVEIGLTPIHSLGESQISGTTLSPQGAILMNGLDTGIEDTLDITVCTVFKYEAGNSFKIISGNLGIQSISGGHSFFQNSNNDLRFNERGGVGVKTLRTASQLTDGDYYFIASVLDQNDVYRIAIFDTANSTHVSVIGAGAGRSASSSRDISAGNVHYVNSAFSGDVTIAEMIVFDSALTITQLIDVAARSRTRMLARGITIE